MSRPRELIRIDYVVVGAGLFGSVFARHAAEAGCQVLLVDRREHIGGNCYTQRTEGIDIHQYGPHIFHTNNHKVWQFVNRFAVFNNYRHRGVVRSGGRLFSFPINLQTLHELWGVCTPEEARRRLAAETQAIDNPSNLEEWALSQIGKELYETFVRGYTTKQWGRDPALLPASVLRRIPIRLTWDDSYFDDAYQGIPLEGYTRLFENMLDHPSIRVELGVDYLQHRKKLDSIGNRVVFSGMIDQFFDFHYGPLEYRSLRFETDRLEGDFQGAAIVNNGDACVPYTRTVEHKHFTRTATNRTVITREYPQPYKAGREAFYPISTDHNERLAQKYKTRAACKAPHVIFGGRLGTYRYHDMHQVIAQAMSVAKHELGARLKAA